MKKILCFLCMMLFLGGCGNEKSSSLPEDLEKVLMEYLNYEAWCNPNDFSQEETTCSYRVYHEVEEDPRFPQTFLEIERDGKTAWYCCTYTRQKVYCIQAQREVPEGLEETAFGELVLPEVTEPVFTDSDIKKMAMQKIQGRIDDYCARAFEEAYHAGECIEVYMADFCMENGMMPPMYVICGDKVCELYSGLSRGMDWMLADMDIVFWTETNEDGTFVTVAKEDVDEERFARVCQIAVLHAECKKGEDVKFVLGTEMQETGGREE